jgi:hypothetical protein
MNDCLLMCIGLALRVLLQPASLSTAAQRQHSGRGIAGLNICGCICRSVQLWMPVLCCLCQGTRSTAGGFWSNAVTSTRMGASPTQVPDAACRLPCLPLCSGAEADSFSLAVWRDLSTAGGLRRIADLWTAGIAQLTWSCNQSAADSVRGSGSSSSSSNSSNSRIEFSSSDGYAAAAAAMPQDMQQQAQDVDVNTEAAADAAQDAQQQQREAAEDGVQPRLKNNSPPNYPSPCLLGSPFTTLAVTHNYHSMLHAEPLEHPFSYIMWLDVLAPGSEMQVRRQACACSVRGRCM